MFPGIVLPVYRIFSICIIGCLALLASACAASQVEPSAPFGLTPPYLPSGATPFTMTPMPPLASAITPQVPVTVTASSPSPTVIVGKLPPPLANVRFPAQPIAYPADWHPDLRYPNQFNLVEATSGISPSGKKGWAVKLVYQGDARVAADLLSDFFAAKGWQTLERTELDSKGFLLLFQRGDKQHTGAIVIDPDTQRPGYIKIVATVFP